MKIISINAGSSSLKYSLFNMDDESVISSGVFEVKTGDVISIVVESQDMEASLDGVSFAVKGV